jgi:hypothetical protein
MPQLADEHGLREVGMHTKIAKQKRRYACPVCGYALEYPPNDFNICPSCGVEFGYETAGRSFEELRREWVNTGARWASRVDPRPKNWNPWMQLIQSGYLDFVPFSREIHIRTGNAVSSRANLASQRMYTVQVT